MIVSLMNCERFISARKHLCLNNSNSKAEDVSAYTLAAWVMEIAVIGPLFRLPSVDRSCIFCGHGG